MVAPGCNRARRIPRVSEQRIHAVPVRRYTRDGSQRSDSSMAAGARDTSGAFSFPVPATPVSGRPLVNLSFAINYAICGLDVSGYHVWNITVHVLCGIVLFALVRRTLGLPGLPAPLAERATNLGFAAALIWTLHPLNTEVVDLRDAADRIDDGVLLPAHAVCQRARDDPLAVVAVVSCLLGVACKESMVTAPVMVVLFDRVFLFESFREAWRARWRWYAGLMVSWVPLGLLAMGPHSRLEEALTGTSPWTYLLNQAPLLTRYLHLAVWPRILGIPVRLADERSRSATCFRPALFIVALAGAHRRGLARSTQAGVPRRVVLDHARSHFHDRADSDGGRRRTADVPAARCARRAVRLPE